MNTFHYSALKRYALQPLVAGLSVVALIGCNAQSVPALLAANPAENTSGTQTQSSTESSITADLSNDALIAPSEPTLQITASPGELVLSWSAGDDTQVVSIYHYDASKGSEQKLDINIDPVATRLTLPSMTHLSAWHRAQYRVELCSDMECISSPRVAVIGLTEKTLTHIKPSVFIKNERYAQDIAINENASVFAITRPLEGSIDIHFKSDNQWVLTQSLRLSDLTLSSTRQIHLSLSANGDVIAALISDSSTMVNAQIRIIERLGEAWIETQQLAVESSDNTDLSPDIALTPLPNAVLSNQRALHLSAQGERLLLRIDNSMSVYERGSLGWVSIESLGEPLLTTGNSEQAPPSIESSNNPQGAMPLLAVSTSASLHRLLTLHEKEQQVWLIQWQESVGQDLLTHWLPGTPVLVSGLNASRDISLMSNDQGNRILIAGWEDSGLELRTPVMWRFNVNETDLTATASDNSSTHSLNVIDSLRLSPTRQTNANLRFSSNRSLTNLAFGWQSEENAETGTLKDASLITYSYHAATRQWLTALELPEAIPTLAKQTFAGKVVISADGSALLLGSSDFSQGLNLNSTGVLVLH